MKREMDTNVQSSLEQTTQLHRLLTINGVTKTIRQWSDQQGGDPSPGIIYKRLQRKWDGKRAVYTKALNLSARGKCGADKSPWRKGFSTPLSKRGQSSFNVKKPRI